MIPGPTVHKATAIDLVGLVVECAVCGRRSHASVLATAHGLAIGAPLGIGEAESSAQATEHAASEIAPEAASLAKLARCPHCGARDPAELRRTRLHLNPADLFIGFFFVVPATILGAFFNMTGAWIAILILLVMKALFAWRYARQRCADADQFVEIRAVSDASSPYRRPQDDS